MDAIAITGVSRGRRWFRVEGVVGGEDRAARLFGDALDVLDADGVALLAAGGRRVYFAQPGEQAPLVPLPPAQAESFDPLQLPIEELPRFAFAEQASDEDIDTLLAVRMGEDPDHFGLRLRRLEALEWVDCDHPGHVELTALGLALLRQWLGTVAPAEPVPQIAPAHATNALRRAA